MKEKVEPESAKRKPAARSKTTAKPTRKPKPEFWDGADDYVTKPSSFVELNEAIRALSMDWLQLSVCQ